MAKETLIIELTADDELTAKLKRIIGDLQKTDAQTKTVKDTFKKSFTEINQAVELAKKAIEVFKKAYNFTKEGAELEVTTLKFDRLAESIGTTSDELLMSLRRATDGIMSDQELMQSAADMIGLGLANTEDQAIRLANVSSQLGMNMNQLTLTLTNQTNMRFDTLNMRVAGFDEKLQKLKKTGMDADEAFTEAFLQQAEEQLLRVGSVTEMNIGSYMRFEAAIKNAMDRLKTSTDGPMADFLDSLTEGINFWPDIKNGFAEAEIAIRKQSGSYAEYKEILDDVLEGTGMVLDEQGRLNAVTSQGELVLVSRNRGIKALSEAEWDHKGVIADLSASYQIYHDAMLGVVDSSADLNKNMQDANGIYSNVINSMKTYNEQLLFSITASRLDGAGQMELAKRLGLLDDATVAAYEITESLAQSFKDGETNAGGYAGSIIEVNDAIRALQDKHVTITVTTVNEEIYKRREVTEFLATPQGPGMQRALGGAVIPGNKYVVGDNGMEFLEIGQNGIGRVTPVNNITNNYNLGVHTSSSNAAVQRGFHTMQMFAK